MENPNERLVKLLGFCEENNFFALIYSFMKGGSLENLLNNEIKRKSTNSKQRLQISLDIGFI